MHKTTHSDPLSGQLRRLIETSGVSRYRLWKETGVDQAVLSRFMAGEGGLSMDGIDRLAAALRLRLSVESGQLQPHEGDDFNGNSV